MHEIPVAFVGYILQSQVGKEIALSEHLLPHHTQLVDLGRALHDRSGREVMAIYGYVELIVYTSLARELGTVIAIPNKRDNRLGSVFGCYGDRCIINIAGGRVIIHGIGLAHAHFGTRTTHATLDHKPRFGLVEIQFYLLFARHQAEKRKNIYQSIHLFLRI